MPAEQAPGRKAVTVPAHGGGTLAAAPLELGVVAEAAAPFAGAAGIPPKLHLAEQHRQLRLAGLHRHVIDVGGVVVGHVYAVLGGPSTHAPHPRAAYRGDDSASRLRVQGADVNEGALPAMGRRHALRDGLGHGPEHRVDHAA